MIRAERLNQFDQLAISEKFRDCFNYGAMLEDIFKFKTIQLEVESHAAILSISNSFAISLSTVSPSSLRFTNLSKSITL